MPKAKEKKISTQEKEVVEIVEEGEETEKEEASLHGVVNPLEAAKDVRMLDQALQNMNTRTQSGEIKDVVKDTMKHFKIIITKIVPTVAEPNIITIICSINNPTCLALRPRTEEMEEMLEDMMLLEDNPSRNVVASSEEEIAPLTDDPRDILVELFDNLEVAHEHISRSCSSLARLSRTLNLAQLMMVLRASTWPLIQINALEGFLDKPLAMRKAELPEDTNSSVRLTMIPNLNIEK